MNNIDLVKALHHIWNTGDLALGLRDFRFWRDLARAIGHGFGRG
jgi:hypothetical protein